MIPWFLYEQIHLGPLTLQVWGLLVSLGFALGGWIAIKEAKRKGVDPGMIFDLLVWILAGSVVGARLFYVIGHYRDYTANSWSVFQLYEGGMAFFGGFLGAAATALIFIHRKKLPLPKIADIVAPALAAGYAVGRLGCVMIHDHLGRITTVPWGIQTPEGVVRHETSIYEMVFNGIILFPVLWFLRKRMKNNGTLAIVFLVWFLAVRFITDSFRATDVPVPDIRTFGLTGAQIIILGIFVVGLIHLLIYPNKHRKPISGA
ncbi:MAG TPA: prolipoprotein diacylglyceryl transferase [Patescibacteria group bacterium]|nr:prolipoprotein diacylglyceryl transferase [Patescibacteria group bacterium]